MSQIKSSMRPQKISRQKIFKLIALLGSLYFAASGCSKEAFPKFILLNSLRVIALQTPTPETNAGDSVTVTPYVSDVNNLGPWTYSAEGCLDPGISYGAAINCVGSATRTVFATNQTLTAGLLTAANVYTGNADSITIPAGITAAILTGRGGVDTYNGVNYLVVYTISNAAGESVKSFRRIVITESAKTAKNANPSTSDILANNVSLGALAVSSEYVMTALYASGAAETYSAKDANGNLTTLNESLLTTWFITDGEMKYYRTGQGDVNTYKTPESFASTRKSAVVAVTRDSRGGINIMQRIVH